MWEKNKGTNKRDKSTVTFDVGTAQYDDETVKCEKKNKGTTSGRARNLSWRARLKNKIESKKLI